MEESIAEVHRPDKGPDARRPRPTNENPNFVREYFAASRLHFIGSFRARFETMMGQVARRLNVHPSTLLLPPATVRPPRPGIERIIVHVDMDCFFASVAIATNPRLSRRPIAVCHAHVSSDGSRTLGNGEISSCSYEARAQGVHAGMFFAKAKALCPALIGVPYNFEAYERVSIAIYSRFFSIPGAIVEACSVDEAYIDITDVSNVNPEKLVSELRAQIYADNSCCASAGIGPSRLLARLATKRAKPNGQLRVRAAQASEFVATLGINDLPGVGWRTSRKLAEMGIDTCAQLLALPLSRLQGEFGEKHGRGFYDAVRGIDERPVQPMRPRKSIGAEASWGVRFDASPADHAKCVKFINDMAGEVATRVLSAGALGTKLLYKAYKKKNVKGPSKYYGHGPCDILTRSARLAGKVDANNLAGLMAEACQRIHSELKIPNNEFRGVGIQLTNLTFENLTLDGKHSVGGGATSRIDAFLNRSSVSNPFSKKSLKRELLEYDAKHAKRLRTGPKSEQVLQRGQEKDNGCTRAEQALNNALESSRIGCVSTLKPNLNLNNTTKDDPERKGKNLIDVVCEESAASTRKHVAVQDCADAGSKPESPGTLEIPGEWDPTVFAALPETIRDELLASHLQNRHAEGSAREASVRIAQESDPTEASGTQHRRQRMDRSLAGTLKSPGRSGRGGHRESKSVRGRRGKRGPMQVTMTQFAQVAQLKTTGHPILNASQFETKTFGECMEIAADLNAGNEKRNGFPSETNVGISRQTEKNELTPPAPHGSDIPPPPGLSSDSESEVEISKDVAMMIKEHIGDNAHVFVDESVVEMAGDLQLWMAHVGGNLRSAHIELLRSRLFELVRLHKLTRVCSEIRTIRVFAGDLKETKWTVALGKLIADLQRECRKIHGFTLKLDEV